MSIRRATPSAGNRELGSSPLLSGDPDTSLSASLLVALSWPASSSNTCFAPDVWGFELSRDGVRAESGANETGRIQREIGWRAFARLALDRPLLPDTREVSR
jgi:hypothetical protein